MNPINGVAELIRLLQLAGRSKTPSEAAPSARGRSDTAQATRGTAAPEELLQVLKTRLHAPENQAKGSLNIFVETVLEWKLKDFSDELDLSKLSAQVKETITQDPAIKAQLEKLLLRL